MPLNLGQHIFHQCSRGIFFTQDGPGRDLVEVSQSNRSYEKHGLFSQVRLGQVPALKSIVRSPREIGRANNTWIIGSAGDEFPKWSTQLLDNNWGIWKAENTASYFLRSSRSSNIVTGCYKSTWTIFGTRFIFMVIQSLPEVWWFQLQMAVEM